MTNPVNINPTSNAAKKRGIAPAVNTADNFGSKLLRQAWQDSGLSLRQLGRQANTSHATLNAYMKGSKSPSTATLERIIGACGYAIDTSLRPRIRFSNGVPRGEELAQVLTLAEQFPARQDKELKLPIFSKHAEA